MKTILSTALALVGVLTLGTAQLAADCTTNPLDPICTPPPVNCADEPFHPSCDPEGPQTCQATCDAQLGVCLDACQAGGPGGGRICFTQCTAAWHNCLFACGFST